MARPTKKGLPISTGHKIRDCIIDRDVLQCIECNKGIETFMNSKNKLSLIEAEFHHIIPMIYGGNNNHENMCLLCKKCHAKVHSGNESAAKYFKMRDQYRLTGKLLSNGRE